MLFKVAVTFRLPDAYSKHVVWGTVTGELTLDTFACHLEPVLAKYNVDYYRVDWCEHQVQIMKDFKQIPRHYYEEV